MTDAEALRLQGNEAFKRGEFGVAVGLYKSAIEKDPSSIALYTNLALAHSKGGNHEEAATAARSAIALGGDSAKAFHLLGKSLIEMGNTDDAIVALTRALSLSSSASVVWRKDIENALYKAKKKVWETKRDARRTELEELQSFLDTCIGEWQQRNSTKEEQDRADAMKQRLSSLLHPPLEEVSRPPSPSLVPDHFVCGITFGAMMDPVVTPSGNSFERAAIEEHMKRIGEFDPISRAPMNHKSVYPNLNLKKAIDNYLNENPWAYFE